MPIHDWTRVDAGTYHDFHQGWTIEIRNALNNGGLPPGYFARADHHGINPNGQSSLENRAVYARESNRLAIRHSLGRVVAMIEVVSPGKKDNRHAIRVFVAKAIDFLRNGIHFVLIDLFPPTPRDPEGIHQLLWEELVGEPFEPRPADKPLTVAGYDAGEPLTAYVDPVAVGDVLTDQSATVLGRVQTLCNQLLNADTFTIDASRNFRQMRSSFVQLCDALAEYGQLIGMDDGNIDEMMTVGLLFFDERERATVTGVLWRARNVSDWSS